MTDNMPGDHEIADVWANVRALGHPEPNSIPPPSAWARASRYAVAVGFFEQTIRDLAADLQKKQDKEPQDYQEAVMAWRRVAMEYKDERDYVLKTLKEVRAILGETK